MLDLATPYGHSAYWLRLLCLRLPVSAYMSREEDDLSEEWVRGPTDGRLRAKERPGGFSVPCREAIAVVVFDVHMFDA